MIACNYCGVECERERFYGRSRRCPACSIARTQEWRAKNPDRAKATSRKSSSTRLAAHLAMTNQLKDVPCMDCGGRFPPECMDFDHRDKGTKVRSVAQMGNQSRSVVLREIAKCDIVCSNCHRIRTKQRRYQSCRE